MKIYNTLSRKQENFIPLVDGHVSMYVCGPTVYDMGHIGHGRAAVTFDIMRRFFIYKGFQVTFVSNFTDIDDKMIKRAGEMGISVPELAERIIPEYLADFGALGVLPADLNPKATEYIEPMIELIDLLDKKEFTYVIPGDGVYFDVTHFSDYGKLSGQKLDELIAGARVETNVGKRNPQDFVLWKFEKPGEPAWDSPWGRGRPGWHIECSAMTWKTLGKTFDIHGGGQDLIFPHHECEIAQSESALGTQFARYWIHNGFITINQEKMSKSLGNFFTIRDVLKKYSGRVIRFMYLQTHYHSPIDFSDALLDQAKNTLERVDAFTARMRSYEQFGVTSVSLDELCSGTQDAFDKALENDFCTPDALAAVFECIKNMNKLLDEGTVADDDIEKVMALLRGIDRVLGVLFVELEELDEDIFTLIGEREEARKRKDFGESDRLRSVLKEKGFVIEDTPKGPVWKRL